MLKAQGHTVYSTDLIMRGYEDGRLDFLKSKRPLGRNIITNPPYGTHGLGDAFIRKSLTYTKQTGGKVAMLLNLRSLAHPSRTAKFLNSPPSAVYILDELTCWPNGEPTSKNARIAKQQYYWAVWEAGFKGDPKLGWLSPAEFVKEADSSLSTS